MAQKKKQTAEDIREYYESRGYIVSNVRELPNGNFKFSIRPTPERQEASRKYKEEHGDPDWNTMTWEEYEDAVASYL